MNASLFLITNLVVVIAAGIVLRLWLRNQPDPSSAPPDFRRHHVAGLSDMLAALVLSLVSKTPQWLLTSPAC